MNTPSVSAAAALTMGCFTQVANRAGIERSRVHAHSTHTSTTTFPNPGVGSELCSFEPIPSRSDPTLFDRAHAIVARSNSAELRYRAHGPGAPSPPLYGMSFAATSSGIRTTPNLAAPSRRSETERTTHCLLRLMEIPLHHDSGERGNIESARWTTRVQAALGGLKKETAMHIRSSLGVASGLASHTATAVALLLALGCQTPRYERVEGPAQLNSGLQYVPWQPPASTADLCRTPERAVEGAIAVRPGMKLGLCSVPADSATPPMEGISAFTWVCPDPDSHSSDDALFLTHLLATGNVVPPSGEAADNDSWQRLAAEASRQIDEGRGQVDAASYNELARSVRTQLRNLAVALRHGDPSNVDAGHALSVREWLSARSGAGAATTTPEEIVLTFEGRPVEGAERPTSMAVTLGTRALAAGSAAVEIAVRADGDVESHFVPIHWTVADAERWLGVEVKGIRRSSSFLVRPASSRWECNELIADDGYFTVWFKPTWRFYRADRVFLADAAQKQDLLLGHGDVLLLGERKSATDKPELR